MQAFVLGYAAAHFNEMQKPDTHAKIMKRKNGYALELVEKTGLMDNKPLLTRVQIALEKGPAELGAHIQAYLTEPK